MSLRLRRARSSVLAFAGRASLIHDLLEHGDRSRRVSIDATADALLVCAAWTRADLEARQ